MVCVLEIATPVIVQAERLLVGANTIASEHEQVFDVLNFDLIVMMRLPYVPGAAEWVYEVRRALPFLTADQLPLPHTAW